MGNSCQYGNKLGLLLQLEVEYEDGSSQIIGSDDSFKSSTGHLIYSDLFIGEKVDARLIKQGWSRADTAFDDSDWLAVEIKNYALDKLVAQYGEPVRAVVVLPAVQVIRTPAGDIVVDFGQVIAGRIRMTVQGERGTEIILEHSEVLDENGNFINNIMGRFKDQKDIFVLQGGEPETFEPKFTYHGFRYVRVSGYDSDSMADEFKAVVLSSDLRNSGEFECSDSRINRLQANIKWSQRANLISIPTDCPQRERAGWTGDIQVFGPTACYNMDVLPFLGRWLRNLVVEQADNGEVPNVIPYHDSMRIADSGLGGKISSAGWGDAVVIVPWTLYQAYGDTRVLAENYGAMVKWIHYIARTAAEEVPDELVGKLNAEQQERQKYLWNTGFHFGDWLLPSLTIGKDGSKPNPIHSALFTKELVATCFYAYSTQLMADIAKVLGKQEESESYAELNRKVRHAFAEEYVMEDGRLKAHYQGIYVLALQHHMVPEAMRELVLNQLVTLIEDNGFKLDTGFVSIPFLMDVLCANGRSDMAYRLLYQTECPSWLYEVEQGATTIWESWQSILPDGKVTNVSYNHYAFGCIGDWLYRYVGGLDKGQPGYKHAVINPHIDCGLTHARAEHETVYGTLSCAWEKSGEQLTVNVQIPANTTARILLPCSSPNAIKESNSELGEAMGVYSIHARGHQVELEVGSGDYQFHISQFVN